MEHYSSIKLSAYLKYEDQLAVLDLKGNKLLRVPDAVTELIEIDKLVLDENNLIDLPASISKLKKTYCAQIGWKQANDTTCWDRWPEGAEGAVGEIKPAGWFTYQYTEADQA